MNMPSEKPKDGRTEPSSNAPTAIAGPVTSSICRARLATQRRARNVPATYPRAAPPTAVPAEATDTPWASVSRLPA